MPDWLFAVVTVGISSRLANARSWFKSADSLAPKQGLESSVLIPYSYSIVESGINMENFNFWSQRPLCKDLPDTTESGDDFQSHLDPGWEKFKESLGLSIEIHTSGQQATWGEGSAFWSNLLWNVKSRWFSRTADHFQYYCFHEVGRHLFWLSLKWNIV